MNELDRINKIMDDRNWFHMDDAFHIVYCAYDGRKSCHSEFHASTRNEVRVMVLNSPMKDEFLKRQRSFEQFVSDEIRSRQISANVRGDRDEDIRLFNEWSNLTRKNA